MATLADYAANVYSQGGEDGAIAEVFRRIGEGNRTCVEFGAGDGIACSNTANLRRQGWHTVLIEADGGLVERIGPISGEEMPLTIHRTITPGGADRIDAILAEYHLTNRVDLMSIDVDGPDYWIFLGMEARPRLVIIEFNPTVPPHLDVIPVSAGSIFGVGALTMRKAAENRGYQMIGITHANMFLVRAEDAGAFADLDTDLARLMPPDRFMYLATDYHGRVVPMGARPEWGVVWPPSDTVFVPNCRDLLVVDPSTIPGTGQLLAELRALRDRIEEIERAR